MAFGDPIEEASCLLPGGSRVEALEVENLPAQSRYRKRNSTVLLIVAVAVVACMAVVTIHGLGTAETTELAESEAHTQKLPSWLRTEPVKLVPLKKLIKEREMMHELAEGKMSDKLYSEEHAKEGPSPHELAMRSVHVMAQKKQQLASRPSAHHDAVKAFHAPRSASEKAEEEDFDHAQAAAVRHALRVAQEKAHGKLLDKHNREIHHATSRVESIQHAHAGRTAHVVLGNTPEKELAVERKQLSNLEKGESREIAAIKKHELHELAQVKYKDHIQEMKLKMGIQELLKKEKIEEKEQQHEVESPAVSEKAKIKAEMARIEEEEAKKLANLKSKLEKVQTHSQQAASGTATLKTDTKAATLAVPRRVKAARESALLEKSSSPGCTKDDCNVDHEDQKWLAHRKAVDYYANLAAAGTGAQKAEAIKKMRELQAQITHDYHHVTGFAVAQEHALPPASNS